MRQQWEEYNADNTDPSPMATDGGPTPQTTDEVGTRHCRVLQPVAADKVRSSRLSVSDGAADKVRSKRFSVSDGATNKVRSSRLSVTDVAADDVRSKRFSVTDVAADDVRSSRLSVLPVRSQRFSVPNPIAPLVAPKTPIAPLGAPVPYLLHPTLQIINPPLLVNIKRSELFWRFQMDSGGCRYNHTRRDTALPCPDI